jgi:hypothetical protein
MGSYLFGGETNMHLFWERNHVGIGAVEKDMMISHRSQVGGTLIPYVQRLLGLHYMCRGYRFTIGQKV